MMTQITIETAANPMTKIAHSTASMGSKRRGDGGTTGAAMARAGAGWARRPAREERDPKGTTAEGIMETGQDSRE